MSYAQAVLLKASVKWGNELTYEIPAELQIHPGDTVLAPFGKQKVKAVVVSLQSHVPDSVEKEKIKKIIQVYPDLRMSPEQLDLAKWMSLYYKAPLKKVIRYFLPRKLSSGYLSTPQKNGYFFTEILSKKRLGRRQAEIIDFISCHKGRAEEGELKKHFGKQPTASLKRLLESGWLKKEESPVYEAFDHTAFSCPPFKNRLTKSQEEALHFIHQASRPVLLHGVTGSGKTEIYLRLIIECICSGKQALLLVPEISLTPQTVRYFKEYMGNRIAVFHSKLTDAKRSREWWKVKTGYAPLVIGSRSAIFAPLTRYGLIIMDEEHEWTYKQEVSPYYETHRLAEYLQRKTGARMILGSATPRLENYQKAGQGEYAYFALPDRVHKEELPFIHVIDLREEFQKKNFSIFSVVLQNKIRERLAKKEQMIFFVNQRGMANAVVCRDCGYKSECPHCEISLKLHEDAAKGARLICHYCDYQDQPPLRCPSCQSVYIKNIGVGTQRVQKELQQLFPEMRILRADGDVVKKKAFQSIYEDFLNHNYDALVGTQMIAKGLDFKKVTLIGVILADIGLHIPDFRSSERLFQILTQVAGRCGRGKLPGEVILQTYQPDHPTIKKIAEYDYDGFMSGELKMREKLNYPPFHSLIKFIVVSSDETELKKHIKIEQEVLEDIFKLHQLDFKISSAPALIPKIANRYYYQVLIRSKNPHIIFDYWKVPKGWRIDVDPIHTV